MLHTLISKSLMVALDSGTMVKPRREEKRIKRSTRRGSSAKVSLGGSGVRISRAAKSCRPRSVKSSTSPVCRL